MSTVTSQSAPAAPAVPANLPLRRRPIDIFFIVMFSLFSLTCIISDAIPTLGIPQTATTTNILAQWNYTYSSQYDPLYMHEPLWLRFITGTSASFGRFFFNAVRNDAPQDLKDIFKAGGYLCQNASALLIPFGNTPLGDDTTQTQYCGKAN